jgi:hypothetical protein
MKRFIFTLIAGIVLSACSPLASIPYSPTQTAASWLQIQPYITIKIGALSFIWVQPSSTVFVYSLGLLAIAAGLYFLRIQATHQSRKWWGIALVLWGAGALLAGTSYQAFSYEIKCAGRTLCSWTSGWEVFYLLLSAASIDAMVVAVAYSCCAQQWRRRLVSYAFVNITAYSLAVLVGVLTLDKFLISFELLLVAAAPGILILLCTNGWRYFWLKQGLDLALFTTWIWLGAVIGAYVLYLSLDIGSTLWKQGVWFSENDVLHLGLISWMAYIALHVAGLVADHPAALLSKE